MSKFLLIEKVEQFIRDSEFNVRFQDRNMGNQNGLYISNCNQDSTARC